MIIFPDISEASDESKIVSFAVNLTSSASIGGDLLSVFHEFLPEIDINLDATSRSKIPFPRCLDLMLDPDEQIDYFAILRSWFESGDHETASPEERKLALLLLEALASLVHHWGFGRLFSGFDVARATNETLRTYLVNSLWYLDHLQQQWRVLPDHAREKPTDCRSLLELILDKARILGFDVRLDFHPRCRVTPHRARMHVQALLDQATQESPAGKARRMYKPRELDLVVLNQEWIDCYLVADRIRREPDSRFKPKSWLRLVEFANAEGSLRWSPRVASSSPARVECVEQAKAAKAEYETWKSRNNRLGRELREVLGLSSRPLHKEKGGPCVLDFKSIRLHHSDSL